MPTRRKRSRKTTHNPHEWTSSIKSLLEEAFGQLTVQKIHEMKSAELMEILKLVQKFFQEVVHLLTDQRFTIQRILVSDILLEQSTEESTLGFDEMLKKLKESESLSSDSFKDASCVIAMSPEVEGVDLCNDIKDEPKDGVPVRDIQQDSIETNHKNSAGDFRDHDSHFTCCICESSVWFLNPLELLQHVSDSHGFHRSERNSLTLCCTFCSFELTSNNFDSSSSDTESLNQDLMLLGAHLEACRGDQVEFKTDAELEDKCGEGELDKSVKGIPQLSRLNFIEMKCFFCDNEPEFESVGELHQHMRATHVHKEECSDKSFFECPECHCHISSSRYSNKDGNTSTSFNIQRSLSGVIRHFVRKHPNSVPSFIQLHHCPHEDCEYLAGTLSEVSTHIKACHTVERIACEKCGKLVRKNTAGKHLNNCGKPKSASVEAEACLHCSECPKTFKTPAGLYSHVQKLHKGDFPFLCDHCPEKFLQRCNLIYHLFTAHGIKTSRTKVFECSSCEYSTPIRAHLKRHERTHHDVAENSVECTTCNRTYASQDLLTKHMKRVHCEKEYQCPVCAFVSKTQPALVRHIKAIHERLKFSCVCSYGTGYLSNLIKHQKSCDQYQKAWKGSNSESADDQKFPCPQCRRSFTLKRHLTNHLRFCKGRER